jgi:RNA polymerase sigma factor (sigma-70 family)
MSDRAHIRDGILLLRCQQGDSDAFADLVQAWQGRLWRHAHRLTGDRDAAADVVQEAWMAVLKGLSRLEDTDAFPKWVFQIVTHKCRDWIRKQQRRRAMTKRMEESAERRPDPQRSAGGRADGLLVALEALPLEQRALITLYYEEGFTTGELADILGIPQGTVKSRLHHARNKIRSHMEDADHE